MRDPTGIRRRYPKYIFPRVQRLGASILVGHGGCRPSNRALLHREFSPAKMRIRLILQTVVYHHHDKVVVKITFCAWLNTQTYGAVVIRGKENTARKFSLLYIFHPVVSVSRERLDRVRHVFIILGADTRGISAGVVGGSDCAAKKKETFLNFVRRRKNKP